MNKKLLVLIVGVALASGLSFCKKEEPVVEEKMETVEDAATKAAGMAEKELDAAAKKAEAEAKKQIDAAATKATGAVKDVTKDIKKPF
ncbi:hypothetical protein P3G55_18315 [Leptospira sp. 96542]|nr:hypothetical protein [Leptospira sp. 96542]